MFQGLKLKFDCLIIRVKSFQLGIQSQQGISACNNPISVALLEQGVDGNIAIDWVSKLGLILLAGGAIVKQLLDALVVYD
jgi:hypothetical protein